MPTHKITENQIGEFAINQIQRVGTPGLIANFGVFHKVQRSVQSPILLKCHWIELWQDNRLK